MKSFGSLASTNHVCGDGDECVGRGVWGVCVCLCVLLPVKEVNNRLTECSFAHLANYFAHPINPTCPLPKLAHPVNNHIHKKINNYDIANKQFRQ